MSLKRLLQTDC